MLVDIGGCDILGLVCVLSTGLAEYMSGEGVCLDDVGIEATNSPDRLRI